MRTRSIILGLALLGSALGVPRPQDEPDPELIKDIFGLGGDSTRSGSNGYSGDTASGDANIDVLVQIVQDGNEYNQGSSNEKFTGPNDYSENQVTNAKIEED